MKNSTCIFSGLAITSFFLTAAIPITLKYKLDNSLFNRVDVLRNFPVEATRFDGVRVVDIRNVNCELISSDTFRIEVEKSVIDRAAIAQRSDTLFVSVTGSPGNIRIFSKDLSVVAKQSDVVLRGSLYPEDIASYVIELDSSKLSTLAISSDHRIRQNIGNVSVKGIDNASVSMAGPARIGNLHLYDISSIEVMRTVGVSDLKVAYERPVRVKSHSHDGQMKVEVN
jgi:hypothetical protein